MILLILKLCKILLYFQVSMAFKTFKFKILKFFSQKYFSSCWTQTATQLSEIEKKQFLVQWFYWPLVDNFTGRRWQNDKVLHLPPPKKILVAFWEIFRLVTLLLIESFHHNSTQSSSAASFYEHYWAAAFDPWCLFNPFHATSLSLYPLKISKKLKFFMFSGGMERD